VKASICVDTLIGLSLVFSTTIFTVTGTSAA